MKRLPNPLILGLVLALAVSNAAWLALYQQKEAQINALKLNLTHYQNIAKELADNLRQLHENMTSLQLRYARVWKEYNRLYAILRQGLQLVNATLEGKPPHNKTLEAATLGIVLEAYKTLNYTLTKLAEFTQLHGRIGPQTTKLIDPDQVRPILMSYITGRLWDPNHPEWLDKDIKAIYEWIVKEILNTPDTTFPIVTVVYVNFSGVLLPKEVRMEIKREYVQGVTETLDRRAGDCEDQAILAVAMLEAYLQHLGYTMMVCPEGEGEKHCAAIAVVDGKIYIVDPTMEYYRKGDMASTVVQDWLTYVGYEPQYIKRISVVTPNSFKVYYSYSTFVSDLTKLLEESKKKVEEWRGKK